MHIFVIFIETTHKSFEEFHIFSGQIYIPAKVLKQRSKYSIAPSCKMDESLDSVLEKCLTVCEARSPHDAVAVALHACLLADGFVCIATGDEVGVLHLECLSHSLSVVTEFWRGYSDSFTHQTLTVLPLLPA